MAVITVKKGLIGKEDMSLGTGTFSRAKSDGSTQTLNQINAEDFITLPAGTRTVTTTTNYLANNAVHNVKDYGATGDGTTDDAAAIQLAIDDATDGGTIYFPPGDYMVSATISLTKPGLHLTGANGGAWRNIDYQLTPTPMSLDRSTSNIIGTTAAMTVISANGRLDADAATEWAGPVIENLSIWDNGGRTTATFGTMTLLHIRNQNNWTVRNVGAFWGAVGMKFQKAMGVTPVSTDNAGYSVENIRLGACSVGMVLDTYVGWVRGGWITRCPIGVYCYKSEADANRPSSMHIAGLKFDILDTSQDAAYDPAIGIQVDDVQSVHIDDCVFEAQPNGLASPVVKAVYINSIDTQSTRVIVTNCRAVDCDVGVDCVKAKYLSVENCFFLITTGTVVPTAAIKISRAREANISNIQTGLSTSDTVAQKLQVATNVVELNITHAHLTVEAI